MFGVGSNQEWGWKFEVTPEMPPSATLPAFLPLCVEVTETMFATLASMLSDVSEQYVASSSGDSGSNSAHELVTFESMELSRLNNQILGGNH